VIRTSRLRAAFLSSMLAATLALGGCASSQGPGASVDPLEPMNRAVFAFNDKLDEYALKPAATAYRDYVPETFRFIAGNMFENLRDVWTSVNNLLQGKPGRAVTDFSRVVVNTTFGFLGMGDVASELGLPKHREDFGQTLGAWGVPTGPYLVLPFFGPSNFRDGPSLIVDALGDPLPHVVDDVPTRNTAYGIRILDTRAGLLRAGGIMDDVALDRYLFMRDGYLQRRRSLVYDGDPPPLDDDDSWLDEDE
jgi:phospholipid-binding lipoprotein MlaA